MSISKLKLSIINNISQIATDTSGLVLCCTNNEDGNPVVHRVIATLSIVSILCELKRAGARKARRVCYDQGVGNLSRYEWNERKKKWTYVGELQGHDEDTVFLKVLPYSFSSANDWNMQELKYAFVQYNVFSVEDAENALEEEYARLEQEKQEEKALVKKNELENLLQNLDKDQYETLKKFIVKDEKLCREIVDTLLSRL
jgi:hypothetical protein